MKIFAHRGASGLAPENTMPAFYKALELGADGIELDVQLTCDGAVVITHDEQIDRVSDGKGWVKDLTLATLQSYDFGGWYHADFAGTRIPTLAELLGWIVDTPLILNIEIKAVPAFYNPDLVIKTWELVEQFDMVDRVIISSFDHRALAEVKQLSDRVKTAVLYEARLLDGGDYCTRHGIDCAHPQCWFVDQALVADWHAYGVEVNVWTVNSKAEADRLQALGVDSIITNYPHCLD